MASTTAPIPPTSPPPLTTIEPIPEPAESSSHFPPELPQRPAPTHRGNFVSRLFTRQPAHNQDVELGNPNYAHVIHHQTTSLFGDVERGTWWDWRFEILVVLLSINAFWVFYIVWSHRRLRI
ncbi:uncharacterized protein K460DRAFT_158910 [Cucurbitaria berberidis CBS 394.84]|uniref:Uncharacterized protein n=1 Tax=Cucurbitaria berberidis CBS 394.84 TaxID=1168544 RepID=A0A9P4L7B6_9PLEO|nr:uncharacterized protein K460DRAFT_158910 [Cucurbitaria berberidis CBS 394.84]KAF1844144.1 hypothetical protein K460DRAFT_158910 [Cucurbitaria berberidis CBS 394.84]